MEERQKFTVKCRAMILHNGKMLVVKHKEGSTVFALPGGHLEKGEGIEECARREIFEELGVEGKIGRLQYVNTYQDPTKHGETIEFIFEVLNGEDFVDLDSKNGSHKYELSQVLWASPEEDVHLLPEQVWQDFKSDQISSDQPRYIAS